MTEAATTLENPTPEKASTPEMPGKEVKMGTASVWVDLVRLKLFRSTLKLQGTTTISEELNQFFDRRIAEIKGLAPNGTNGNANSAEAGMERRQAYETSKKRTFELHMELVKMVKWFKEQRCWTDCLGAFCKSVDYDKTFDAPGVRYGFSGSEKAYDNYCINFIEEASDREADFKEQTTRFLLRNRDVEFVYDWLGFVEKLKERRKLSRQMLMYQLDSLTEEQRLQLQKEDAERKEAARLRKEEETKAKEVRCLEEEKKRQQELDAETEDWDEGEEDQDSDEEEGDSEGEEEGEDLPKENREEPTQECHAIVPVGNSYDSIDTR